MLPKIFRADKILLAEKKENKSLPDFVFQYANAKNYVDKREAIDFAIRRKDEPAARKLLFAALNDSYYELRERALKSLDSADLDATAISTIEKIARQDAQRTTRAAAIGLLGELKNPGYSNLFYAGATDSSYSVAGASLFALSEVDQQRAITLLPMLRKDMKGQLRQAVQQVEVLSKTDADFAEMTELFDKAQGFAKFTQYALYLTYLRNVNNTENFKQGVDKVVAFRNSMAAFNPRIKQAINDQLTTLKTKKQALKNAANAAEIDSQIAYMDEQLK